MENASKAIIMAGGILIGVIILSIAVYLFSSFGGTSQKIKRQIDAKEIAAFNNNFLKYENIDNCTIHDIISLANFAKKSNNDGDFSRGDDLYISVFLGRDELSNKNEEYYVGLLKDSNDPKIDAGGQANMQYYTCTKIETIEYNGYSRVSSITFKKNE